jgi:hypothetical protein
MIKPAISTYNTLKPKPKYAQFTTTANYSYQPIRITSLTMLIPTLLIPQIPSKNWLNTYQGLFTDSISKAKKCTLDGVCSIQSYFQPA